MKTALSITLITLLLGLQLTATGTNSEEDSIKQTIISAYQEGLINNGDTKAVLRGFHPGFNLLIKRENMLDKLPIYNWIQSTEEKVKAGRLPRKDKAKFSFPLVDITKDTAVVKVHFSMANKLVFTDYLLLYRFNDGWKIVSKVYHKHEQSG